MASGNAAIGTDEWGNQYIEVYVFLALIYNPKYEITRDFMIVVNS